jgi:hypothetical protein
MTLRIAWIHYLACVSLVSASALLGLLMPESIEHAGLARAFMALVCLGYAGCGIYLDRLVLRRLIRWHPLYHTVHHAATVRLRYSLLWPGQYVALFIRVGADRAW